MNEVPFDRSYWVIQRFLLAGCYPGDLDLYLAREKLERLLRAGIRVVINLMEEQETNWDSAAFVTYQPILMELAKEHSLSVSLVRFPITDDTTPTVETMRLILDTIDLSIRAARPVFLHCWGGRGRTGTVVGCYLARHGLASGLYVLDRIDQLRHLDPTAHLASPQTDAQREMATTWEFGQ